MNPIHPILIFALILTSCNSTNERPLKTMETFSTLIKSNGTKQFSYILSITSPTYQETDILSGHTDPRKSEPKTANMQNKLALMFDDALNTKLNTTGFCRNGFIKLETQSRRGAMLVKGECKDKASDADREKFPGPEPKKVQVEVFE